MKPEYQAREFDTDLELEDLDEEQLREQRVPTPGRRTGTGAERMLGPWGRHPDAAPPRRAVEGRPADPAGERRDDLRAARFALEGLRIPGAPLPVALAEKFGRALGVDLGDVRVHDHTAAHQAAKDLRARAFTAGNDIAFASGAYAPESPAGERLIAHEVVHVAQQKTAGAQMSMAARMEVGPSGSTVEAEADTGAAALAAGQPFAVARHGSLPGISRRGENDPDDGGSSAGGVPSTGGGGGPDAGGGGSGGGVPDAGGGGAGGAGGQQAGPDAGGGGTGGAGGGGGVPDPGGGGAGGVGQKGGPGGTDGQGGQGGPDAGGGGAPSGAKGGGADANPLGPDSFTGTYATANAYSNKLDGDLTAEFNKRADPNQMARLTAMHGHADATRLASLQFTFNPGSFTSQLIQSVMPSDNVTEHLRQATTQNAYARGASWSTASGWIAGVQTVIEFLRNILRTAADVVGAASSVLGVVAMASAGLALIPPLAGVCGPLAAAAAAAGEILALVKVAADIQDVYLGFAQILLTAMRARLSDDPAERASLCQLIKKEASDISQDVVGILVQGATIGLGKAIGKLAGPAAKEAEAAAKMTVTEFRELAKQVPKAAALSIPGGMQTAKGVTLKSAQRWLRVTFREIGGGYSVSKGFKHLSWWYSKALPGRLPAGKLISPRLAGVNTLGFVAGSASTRAGAQTKVEASNIGDKGRNSATNAPNSGNPVPAEKAQGVTYRYVSYWPDILEKLGTDREWINNAQSRMKDQYILAKDDAGDKAKAVTALKGGIAQYGNRIYVAGGAKAAEAKTGQDQAKKEGDDAKNAADKKKPADEKSKAVGDKANDAKSKADQAKSAADNKKGDKSLWEKIKGAVSDYALTPVFAALGKLQKWIGEVILKYALKLAGMKDSDLDLAGIERKAMNDQDGDKKSEKDAKDTQSKGAEVDKDVEALKDGASDQEKNAIQGMVDALSWMTALDDWDQSLAMIVDGGNQYINDAAPFIKHELDAEKNKDKIDADYVAPVVQGCATVRQGVSVAGANLKAVGDIEIGNMTNALAEKFTGQDTAAAGDAARGSLAVHVADLEKEISSYTQRCDAVEKDVRTLIGTTEYNGVYALGTTLDDLAKGFSGVMDQAFDSFDGVLGKIGQAYVDAYEAAAKEGAPVGPVPVPSPTDKGAPPPGGDAGAPAPDAGTGAPPPGGDAGAHPPAAAGGG